MSRIFRNTMSRIFVQKVYMSISMLMIIASVTVAIFISNMSHTTGNVAIVRNHVSNELEHKLNLLKDNEQFNVSNLTQKPKKSELVIGKYDFVICAVDSTYKIDTVRSVAYKRELAAVLEGVPCDENLPETRSIFVNIMGYILMFILIQGILYAKFYADDLGNNMRRILISPINVSSYLLGCILAFSALTFIPGYATIVAAKLIGIDIGNSLVVYGGLLLLLTLLSNSFAIFMYTIIGNEDTANIMGTAIVILTSVLSGSFLKLPHDYKVLSIFPQKKFMDFVTLIDSQSESLKNFNKVIYIIVLICAFYLVSIIKVKREYNTFRVSKVN